MIKDVGPLLKECEETLKELKGMGNMTVACYVQGFINSINKLPDAVSCGGWRGSTERRNMNTRICTSCGDRSAVGYFCMWCGADMRPNGGDQNESEDKQKGV